MHEGDTTEQVAALIRIKLLIDSITYNKLDTRLSFYVIHTRGKLYQSMAIMNSLHIDGAPVLGHFRALVALGAPRVLLEKALGVTEQQLEIVDTRVPFLRNIKMIEKGVELLGPDVPLKLGTNVSLAGLGVCGHIFRNCEDIKEVIDQFFRYQKLLYGVSGFKITNIKTIYYIEHSLKIPAYNEYNRIVVELAFSSMITILRELVQKELTPLEILLSYRKPKYTEVYRKILSSPMKFNQEKDIIVFSEEQLATAIPRHQSYIKYIMIEHANDLMKELDEWAGFKNEVTKMAIEHLPKGHFDIEMVSRKLKMSRWTVTRKLKKEGHTFQNFMKGLKKDLALDYLENSNLSIMEIAFLLGYSEASAFRRAFKEWTGKNTRDYKFDGDQTRRLSNHR
ncbi:MAG: helix-turn-helix domain-containing protein [Desulfobacteraceae bacterium]|nr:helix-turn-helix domain-containing protein [Desulfobacteraceae bacterium]